MPGGSLKGQFFRGRVGQQLVVETVQWEEFPYVCLAESTHTATAPRIHRLQGGKHTPSSHFTKRLGRWHHTSWRERDRESRIKQAALLNNDLELNCSKHLSVWSVYVFYHWYSELYMWWSRGTRLACSVWLWIGPPWWSERQQFPSPSPAVGLKGHRFSLTSGIKKYRVQMNVYVYHKTRYRLAELQSQSDVHHPEVSAAQRGRRRLDRGSCLLQESQQFDSFQPKSLPHEGWISLPGKEGTSKDLLLFQSYRKWLLEFSCNICLRLWLTHKKQKQACVHIEITQTHE